MRKIQFLGLILLLSVCAFTLERQANADYRARREALARKTSGNIVLLFADPTLREEHDENFYYLTGLQNPNAALLIAPAQTASEGAPARPYTEILFLPPRNLFQERWTGVQIGPGDPNIREVTGFERVEPLAQLDSELAQLLPAAAADLAPQPRDARPPRALYTDVKQGQPNVPLDWLRRTGVLAGLMPRDVKPLIASLRMIKDAGELALIRKASEASVAAHLAAMKFIKPGVTEHQIAATMEYTYEMRGCERSAYSPIVGAGIDGTILHYSSNAATVKAGDLIVMDVAGEYSMYASDITRTAPASGKFTARQREIYDLVLAAQQAAMEAFVPGKSTLVGAGPNSLMTVVREYLNAHGKDAHGEPLGKYMIHGVGHHVGLNVHDASDSTAPLDKGMVFTLEPGIYLPEEGFGVRIEDTVYVDQSGKLVRLTEGLPRTADEVEKAMKK